MQQEICWISEPTEIRLYEKEGTTNTLVSNIDGDIRTVSMCVTVAK